MFTAVSTVWRKPPFFTLVIVASLALPFAATAQSIAPSVAPIEATLNFTSNRTWGSFALDDQTLAQQRGTYLSSLITVGMPAIAHNQVTLWDEIAPSAPHPIPMPSDAAAQQNVTSYFRK